MARKDQKHRLGDDMDKVEVFKDEASEWRWRRRSENGRVVATSGEGYKNHSDALSIARDVNGLNSVEWADELESQ